MNKKHNNIKKMNKIQTTQKPTITESKPKKNHKKKNPKEYPRVSKIQLASCPNNVTKYNIVI